MVLLLIIATVWAVTAILAVALCAQAAHGDRDIADAVTSAQGAAPGRFARAA